MCGYLRLGAADGCVISIQRFGFRHRSTVFICIWTIQTSKVYTIINKKSNQRWSVCYRTGVKDILVIIVIPNM